MKTFGSIVTAALLCAGAAGLATPALAADAALEAAVQKAVSAQAQPWLADASVVSAVTAQNAANASLDQAKVDAMDADWKAGAKAKANPRYDEVSATATSKKLKEIRDASNGAIVEILLMDNRGLNVAQTDGTSDYWQGDEPKWQKVFTDGATVYMTDPETDEGSKLTLTEVSVPVVDPASKKTVGVAMIVLDVDKLAK